MISIVIGKPGSGKSYHVVKYIYNTLTDFIKKDETERVIYTNVSVSVEALNKQLSKDFNRSIDVARFVQVLDSSELRFNPDLVDDEEKQSKRVAGKVFRSISPFSKAFFWNRFPDNALIIIDEIQKYLGSVKEESESERQSLVEYFSLHRHKRHDWIFITQSLMSLAVEVRRVSEKVFEVFNAKSMVIPFPFSIPVRDIETVLVAFGYHRQVYRVRSGYLNGTYKVEYDETVDVVVMEKKVFDLYQTHTLVKGDQSSQLYQGDSVLPFQLGPGQRRRAVWWFLGKHGLHLSIKAGLFIYVVGGVIWFLHYHSVDHTIHTDDGADVQAIESPESSSVDVSLNEVLPVPVGHKKNQDASESVEAVETVAPIISTVIVNNRGIQIDSDWYGVGDSVPGCGRLISADARRGAQYELESLLYLRMFADLDFYRRWVQDVRAKQD